MKNPLVSVVLCAYNAGTYLKQSVRSIFEQTYANWELLIVDDGSTDGSVSDLRNQVNDSRVRFFHQKNAGKPVAMNLAISAMNGQYYVLNDADDLSSPQRIERLVEVMESRPEIAAGYSGHSLILGERCLAPTSRFKDPERCRRDIDRFAMPAHDPTGIYRLSMVGHMRYDESLPVVEGYDYILRVGEEFPMLVVGECLYGYRIHPSSITRANPQRRNILIEKVHQNACGRRGINYQSWCKQQRYSKRTTRHTDGLNYGLAPHFIESAVDLRAAGKWVDALRTSVECLKLKPLSLQHHKPLIYAMTPPRLLEAIRPTR